MLTRLLIGVFAVAVVSAVPPAAADEPSATNAIPLAFIVPATNGYTAEVIAGFDPKADESAVIVRLRGHGGGAIYATRAATVSETGIEADFGALGEVDVHAVRTAGISTESGPCSDRSAGFAAGRWEGTFAFHGEEGFTSVQASRAKATARPILRLVCAADVDEGTGGHSPGALLTVRRRHGGEKLELTVRKNRRVGPTRIAAEVSERRGKIAIARSVSMTGPSRAFKFEIPPGRATVEPSGPLSGSLELTRRLGAPPAVKGDLKLDFPGRADVPLLGPGITRASLVRAVLNPSHPF
ncbi:MAG TPA: hypothetical protein VHE08_07465 [Solirubrobacterales bacterium]|nr:hypothetical protein [Solirubrobacterales bacterium]